MKSWTPVAALVVAVLCCAPLTAQTFYEVADFGPTNHFGLNGSRAIVEDEIIERQPGGGWAVVASLSNGLDVTDCDVFGDTAAIARGGVIDVYDRQPGGSWVLSTTLSSPTADDLGSPILLVSENEVLSRAAQLLTGPPPFPQGYVVQFRRSPLLSTWGAGLSFDAGPGSGFRGLASFLDGFGRSLACSSDRLLVDVPDYSDPIGYYLLFERSPIGTWVEDIAARSTMVFWPQTGQVVGLLPICRGPCAISDEWMFGRSPVGPDVFRRIGEAVWYPPIYITTQSMSHESGRDINEAYGFAISSHLIFQHDEVLDRWVETATLPTTLSSDGLVETEGKTVIAEGKILEAEYFVRGDVTTDGAFDLADVIAQLNGLFGGATLSCPDAADLDDDGILGLNDVVRLLGALYQGQPLPAPTGCREDDSPDSLRCPFFSGCP